MRDDLDVAVGQARHRLTSGELGVRMDDIRAAFRLRQHDGIRPGGHDGIEVGVGQPGRKAVDAHQAGEGASAV